MPVKIPAVCKPSSSGQPLMVRLTVVEVIWEATRGTEPCAESGKAGRFEEIGSDRSRNEESGHYSRMLTREVPPSWWGLTEGVNLESYRTGACHPSRLGGTEGVDSENTMLYQEAP